jgi:hypothetical protein
MRTGNGFDALAGLAVVAPLAGLLAPLAGGSGRRLVTRTGRWGALAAVAVWVVLLAADAAPALAGFAPDRLAMAAAAGTALLAAVVTIDPPAGGRLDLTGALAPPVAAVLGLVVGVIDPPTDIGRATATVLVVAGGALAAVAVAVAVGGKRVGGGLPLAVVAVAPALLLALRGADAAADPMAGVGLLLLAAAVATAVGAARKPGSHAGPVAAASLLVVAVALGPVPAVRPWAALLAGGTVLLATGIGRWTAAALVPGAVAVAVATADVPAAGQPLPAAHVVFAAGLAATVGALVVALRPTDALAADEPSPIAVEAKLAVAALTAWVVVAPGSWRWAVANAAELHAWDRAGAVAVAAAAIAAVAVRLKPDQARRTAAQ